MEFLNTTSLVAAFLAGIAALFAPCCITVLLPSYLGSIFRQKATVFLLTFVFFLGLLTVFLPIGLSFGLVGKIINSLHDPLFLTGGGFLVLLGLSILFGFHFSLPFSVNPNLRKVNAVSVYVLGIFSGLATTCCAPVLAGVMALSVLPGSVFWAGAYTLAYVLGMTVPLFLTAVLIDKSQIGQRLMILRRPLSFKFFGKKFELTFSESLSGLVFLFIGLLIVYLTLTGNLATHASYQLSVNLAVARLTITINRYLGFLPPFFWLVVSILGLGVISFLAVKELKRRPKE